MQEMNATEIECVSGGDSWAGTPAGRAQVRDAYTGTIEWANNRVMNWFLNVFY